MDLPHFDGHRVSGNQAALGSEARLASQSRSSNSAGVRYSRLECLRWRLYHTSTNSKIAVRASARVCQSAPSINSISRVPKKLSATALSQQLPLRLMLTTACCSSSNSRYSFQAY